MTLTIEQLIDHLANCGRHIGLKAPVRVWNLHDSVESLEVRGVAGVSLGVDPRDRNAPCVTLRLDDA